MFVCAHVRTSAYESVAEIVSEILGQHCRALEKDILCLAKALLVVFMYHTHLTVSKGKNKTIGI